MLHPAFSPEQHCWHGMYRQGINTTPTHWVTVWFLFLSYHYFTCSLILLSQLLSLTSLHQGSHLQWLNILNSGTSSGAFQPTFSTDYCNILPNISDGKKHRQTKGSEKRGKRCAVMLQQTSFVKSETREQGVALPLTMAFQWLLSKSDIHRARIFVMPNIWCKGLKIMSYDKKF